VYGDATLEVLYRFVTLAIPWLIQTGLLRDAFSASLWALLPCWRCFLVGAASLLEVGLHRTESSYHCITPKATIGRKINLPLAGEAFGVMQWSGEVTEG
jgi:hypothetical protein